MLAQRAVGLPVAESPHGHRDALSRLHRSCVAGAVHRRVVCDQSHRWPNTPRPGAGWQAAHRVLLSVGRGPV